ncbi:MAG: DUF512 domain-containing protein, partial [bacterium]|nr:DUF512 domain-containing protein [bacterium]
ITLPPLAIRQCRNKCVFCFVDQQPPEMRRTLHIKDDDYRYSFLHGNFITMTNVQEAELDRIIEEKLSPQYISVHATNTAVHQLLLGIEKPDPVVPKIEKLVRGGVTVHAQIVVIPEWNDGDILRESVDTLGKLLTDDGTLALVPVGLTKYRRGLEELRTPTPDEARAVIEQHWYWRDEFAKTRPNQNPLVYCADEWFCIAEIEPPAAEYYGRFDQIENGVGMMRKMELDTIAEAPRWIKRLPRDVKWTWLTGHSAAVWLRERIAPIIMQQVPQLTIEVIETKNVFWGDVVTVANLLTGQDIWQQLEKHGNLGDLIVIPPDVVNGDGLFLDDWTLTELQGAVVHPPVVTYPGSFAPLLRKMLSVN